MWEGQKVSNAEALMKLDPTNRVLTFDTSIARYNLLVVSAFYVLLCIILCIVSLNQARRICLLSSPRGHRPYRVSARF